MLQYGTIQPAGLDKSEFSLRLKGRFSLPLFLLGLLCSLVLVALVIQKSSVSNLLTVTPGTVLNVGTGRNQMTVVVDSNMDKDGFVYAHSFKNGVKYSGELRLTPSTSRVDRYRYRKKLRSKFHQHSAALSQKLNHRPKSISGKDFRRVRTGNYELDNGDANLTTYLVEVHEPSPPPCSSQSSSCPPVSLPCNLVGGCDTMPSSMVQKSTNSIQNQKTVNINMIGFAGASTAVSNGPSNYFGGSWPQQPPSNNNYYGYGGFSAQGSQGDTRGWAQGNQGTIPNYWSGVPNSVPQFPPAASSSAGGIPGPDYNGQIVPGPPSAPSSPIRPPPVKPSVAAPPPSLQPPAPPPSLQPPAPPPSLQPPAPPVNFPSPPAPVGRGQDGEPAPVPAPQISVPPVPPVPGKPIPNPQIPAQQSPASQNPLPQNPSPQIPSPQIPAPPNPAPKIPSPETPTKQFPVPSQPDQPGAAPPSVPNVPSPVASQPSIQPPTVPPAPPAPGVKPASPQPAPSAPQSPPSPAAPVAPPSSVISKPAEPSDSARSAPSRGRGRGNAYFSECDPTLQGESTEFTICIFRSEVGLSTMPALRYADTGVNRLYYVGQNQLPIVDLHALTTFREYVPQTPDVNYAWAIIGQLKVSTAGSYSLCISSDDGSFLYIDEHMLVDDEGLHGMVEKCGLSTLLQGTHTVYVEGFQAGGGVGMELTYSGPDTGGSKVFMRSGTLPSIQSVGSQYYSKCVPSTEGDQSQFTICMFRSEVGLSQIPSIGQADTGSNRLYYAGQGKIPVVNLDNLEQIRHIVPNTPDAHYAWAIFGQLVVQKSGSYNLCITSDDGSKLYVDGPFLLVDNEGLHGMVKKCNPITLSSGKHSVYVEGFQAGGGVGMKISYSGPDTDMQETLMPSGRVSDLYYPSCNPTKPTANSDQFTICMFGSATNLGTTPRIGDAVAMDQISYIGRGELAVVDMHSLSSFRQYVPGTPEVNYVWAIYGKLVILSAGSYNLCISSDDGSKLYVDGPLLVDDDGLHPMVKKCADIYLIDGAHSLYLVGFQAGGGVGMELTYSGADTGGKEIFVQSGISGGFGDVGSQYFTKCDPSKSEESNQFTICMFRSEIGLGTMPKLGLANTGKNRLYYIGKNSLSIVDLHTLMAFREYIPAIPDTNYAWAIYGKVVITNGGSYTLCISSDDGSKLYVDGLLLVDDDGLHPMVEKCSVRTLLPGPHIVYLEGFQAGGGVGMELTYTGPDTGGSKVFMKSGVRSSTTPSQYYSKCTPSADGVQSKFNMCIFRSEVGLSTIPSIGQADTGINRLYYVGKGRLRVVDFDNLDQIRRSVPNTPDSQYAWAIYGQLMIGEAGSYNLCITSDDGSKLYVDGPRLLVDNEGLHGMVKKCGTITLSSGAHSIYLEGFQAGGGVGMKMEYSGPDTKNQVVYMPSGRVSGPYFPLCDPTSKSPANAAQFTICMFQSKMAGNLQSIPLIGDAVATNQLSYVGQGSLPVVDMHTLQAFRQYVPGTPDGNYVWAIYGKLVISSAGSYNLCISSDDGSKLYVDGSFESPLVDDDGLHGMVKRCGTTYLTNGEHLIYLTGFQAWGGVGMELTYSGADTANKEIFMRAGLLPPLSILASKFRLSVMQSLAFKRQHTVQLHSIELHKVKRHRELWGALSR